MASRTVGRTRPEGTGSSLQPSRLWLRRSTLAGVRYQSGTACVLPLARSRSHGAPPHQRVPDVLDLLPPMGTASPGLARRGLGTRCKPGAPRRSLVHPGPLQRLASALLRHARVPQCQPGREPPALARGEPGLLPGPGAVRPRAGLARRPSRLLAAVPPARGGVHTQRGCVTGSRFGGTACGRGGRDPHRHTRTPPGVTSRKAGLRLSGRLCRCVTGSRFHAAPCGDGPCAAPAR